MQALRLLAAAAVGAATAAAAATTVEGLPIFDGADLQSAVNASIAAGESSHSVSAPPLIYPLLVSRSKHVPK